MSATALDALREALGEGAVRERAPLEIDGRKLTLSLCPADGAELAAALAALSRLGLAAIVRGGGTRMALGNPPRRADVLLSTEALRGVDEFDPDEGVCHLRAGTPLADARARVREAGWELPLDAPGEAASVGGVLAAAAVGPRALGFGRPRDVVLGLEVVQASGVRTRCGGRVVKNVTGYDLAKLYTGACGSLGVIEGAWLRLRPRAERVLELTAREADPERACRGALDAARRATARAAALRIDTGGAELWLELAGEAAAVARDSEALAQGCGASEAPGGGVAHARSLQGSLGGESGLRFRVSLLPTRLAAAVAPLREAGASLLAYPGLGLLYAGFADATPGVLPGIFAATERAARAGVGGWLLEQAPLFAKLGRDVFGELGAEQPLVRALKARFDPDGVLNPGRFAGGV